MLIFDPKIKDYLLSLAKKRSPIYEEWFGSYIKYYKYKYMGARLVCNICQEEMNDYSSLNQHAINHIKESPLKSFI